MRGEFTDDATRRLNKLAQTLAAFEPPTVGQQLLHAETLHRLNEMTELRRKRLHAIGGGLPPVMWAVVLIGAVLTISVTYLLQIERKVQVTLTALFAMFIGLVVFVIASLDQPLSGPLAIDSRPYQLALDRLIDLK